MKFKAIFSSIRVWYYKRITDRRKYARVPITVKATNPQSGSFSYYQATNISEGGMFLKAQEPLLPGAELDLEFVLPGENSETRLMLKSQVVRTQNNMNGSPFPSGMGIRFVDPSEDCRKAIDWFVRMNV